MFFRVSALALACLFSAAFAADEPVVLLTGFEPFGGATVNASWQGVKVLQGKVIAGHRVETVELPVVYDAIDAPLKAAIEKIKPAAVFCFGEGTPTVQIETIARNGYHPFKPKDNKGLPPPRTQIVPLGIATIPTRLPADAIGQALTAANIPARKSTDAGGYLCNECFYRLMAASNAPAIRGFIHVPVLGTKDENGGVFDLERIQKAVHICVETGLTKGSRN